jgi:hypothetical protein
MKLPAKQKIPTDELRKMALAALVSALDGDDRETKEKSGHKGVRLLAAGAVIYGAGLAAYKNRDFLRDQLLAGQHGEEDDVEDEEAEDEVVEEPEAEELEPEPDDAGDVASDEDDEDDEEAAPTRRKRPSRSRS